MPILTALLICLAPVAHDGDTVKCADGTNIRIWGVNAPELGQPGADVSTVNLTSLTLGGLACHPQGASYNRIVAQCWNGHGVDVSKAQLDGGFAKEWCGYSRNYYGTCKK